MKIVADERIPFLKGVFEPYCEVRYYPGKDIQQHQVKDADALIVRTRTRCNEALLKDTQVKIVVTATIGTDHFDIPWLEHSGIEWGNAPGCNSGSVRQYIGSVLSHLIKDGMIPGRTTLGIVGVGMVGSKVEQLARALGFKVLLNDPPRQRQEKSHNFCDLETILKEADVITFHTPLTVDGLDATYHLFNKDTFKLLKAEAIIINSSRGEVICSDSLMEGLSTNKISRVVLDVWENEPDILPELQNAVWIGTPHIAGYSMDGKANGTTMAVQKVASRLGLPLTDWRPDHVPLPENRFIFLDSRGRFPCHTVADAILSTYDVRNDDAMLRAHPETFELLRGNYPLRREFESWIIRAGSNLSDDVIRMLKDLGFSFETSA